MKKILLVNDSKFESVILKDALTNIGYNVMVSNEYDAINDTRIFDPNFAIVNLTMKEIKGDELVGFIKLENPKIKCILSSSNPINLEDFNKRKVDFVFRTPIKSHDLELVLKNATSENTQKFMKPLTKYLQENSTVSSDEVLDTNNSLEEKKEDLIAEVSYSPKFCSACGEKLNTSIKKVVFCPYCGGKI